MYFFQVYADVVDRRAEISETFKAVLDLGFCREDRIANYEGNLARILMQKAGTDPRDAYQHLVQFTSVHSEAMALDIRRIDADPKLYPVTGVPKLDIAGRVKEVQPFDYNPAKAVTLSSRGQLQPVKYAGATKDLSEKLRFEAFQRFKTNGDRTKLQQELADIKERLYVQVPTLVPAKNITVKVKVPSKEAVSLITIQRKTHSRERNRCNKAQRVQMQAKHQTDLKAAKVSAKERLGGECTEEDLAACPEVCAVVQRYVYAAARKNISLFTPSPVTPAVEKPATSCKGYFFFL